MAARQRSKLPATFPALDWHVHDALLATNLGLDK